MGGARAARRHAGGEEVHRLVGEDRRRGVEQREVDELAAPGSLARDQRRLDRDDAVEAGEEVADRDARPLRRPVRLAGDVHEAGHALGQVVVAGALGVGTRLAEAGDRAIDRDAD